MLLETSCCLYFVSTAAEKQKSSMDSVNQHKGMILICSILYSDLEVQETFCIGSQHKGLWRSFLNQTSDQHRAFKLE